MRRVLCSGWLLLALACHEDLELISENRDAGSSVDVDEPKAPDASQPPTCNCADGQICTMRTAQGCEPLASLSAIAAGTEHTCRVTMSELSCWGANAAQQLNTGDTTNQRAPYPVSRNGWVSIAAGRAHTCGLRDRAVWCWGDNSQGQLGLPVSAMTSMSAPMGMGMNRGGNGSRYRAQNIYNVGQIECGGDNCCALQFDGALFCWGANSEGNVGIGSTSSTVFSPKQVMPGTTFLSVSVGAAHSCAVRREDDASFGASGALLCWGRNSSGQLGQGTAAGFQASPVQVGVVRTWTSVAAGTKHTCGLVRGGTLHCWGDNADGQLGVARVGPDGTPMIYHMPNPVDSNTDWARVAAGAYHSCGIKRSGELRCWGRGSSGQLGSGVVELLETPKVVSPPNGWLELALGERHSCGLDSDRKLYCWGDNMQGQLGVGDTTRRDEPAPLQ